MGRKLVVKQFIIPVCIIFFLVAIGSVAAQYNPGHPADQIDFSVPIDQLHVTGSADVGDTLIATTVGVGTQTPATKLFVLDPGATTWETAKQLEVSHTNDENFGLQIGYAWNQGQYAGGKIQALDNAAPTALLLNPDGGYVGIGAEFPNAPLDVASPGSGTPSIVVRDGDDFAVAADQHMEFGHWDGSTYTERMRIDTAGDVGIGTASPSYKLDVAGPIRAQNPSHQIRLYDTDSGADEWTITTVSDQKFGIYEDGSTNRFTIENGGQVGIGKTSPDWKLDVAGDIQADGGWVRVTGDRGIFFQDYGGGWYMTDDTWIRSYNSKDVYVNTKLRADGGLYVGNDEYFYRNSEDVIRTGDSFVVDGEIRQGTGDAGGYEIQTGGRIYSGSYTRADGGFNVDGRVMISDDGYMHTARSTAENHYGYFEVRDNSGDRGAYFGWGNGGDAVTLHIDAASRLDITGGNIVATGDLEIDDLTSDYAYANQFIDRADSGYRVVPRSVSTLYQANVENGLRINGWFIVDDVTSKGAYVGWGSGEASDTSDVVYAALCALGQVEISGDGDCECLISHDIYQSSHRWWVSADRDYSGGRNCAVNCMMWCMG